MRDFNRNNRSNNRRSNNSFGRPRMYPAVCDECGQECEVPFKPTNGKPIFCSACFSKKDAGRDRSNFRRERRPRSDNRSNQFEQELQIINKKLDEILQNLSSTKSQANKIAIKPKTEKKIIKKLLKRTKKSAKKTKK